MDVRVATETVRYYKGPLMVICNRAIGLPDCEWGCAGPDEGQHRRVRKFNTGVMF